MALDKETWLADIQENLFKDNYLLNKAVNHDSEINNKVVHIPQSGANPTITKNLAVFPAVITRRTDSELTYNVDAYYLAPILIEKGQEDHYLSYEKRMSVLRQNISTMEEAMTNNVLFKWAGSGAGAIVRTTGAASATALAPSATGTRLALTLADILKAKAVLDSQNVPQTGRILAVHSDVYNTQLLANPDVYRMDSYGTSALPSGVVNRIHGFDIVIRPTITVYDASGTPVIKAVNDSGTPSAPAVTDNIGCFAYHPAFVCKALGGTEVIINEDRAEYYGSIISAYSWLGAAKMRSNQLGVVSIVQG